MLPSPPMITASKPKISRAGPIDGSKLARTAKQHAGDGDDRERERHRQREDVGVVEAHQLRNRLVVGGGAEGAAERRAVEQPLQAGDHRDRERELEQRQHADRQAAADAGCSRSRSGRR